jgi:hypothetical protein
MSRSTKVEGSRDDKKEPMQRLKQKKQVRLERKGQTKLKTRNSKLETQNSKLKTQNSNIDAHEQSRAPSSKRVGAMIPWSHPHTRPPEGRSTLATGAGKPNASRNKPEGNERRNW